VKFDPDRCHRRSIRVQGYDFSQAGAYFVTIVVQNRNCVLGTVEAGCILLTESGKLVEHEWLRLSLRFKNLELMDFVRTPRAPCRRTIRRAGGAPSAGSIPTIVRSFKASTTRRYRQMMNEPKARLWQRN